MELRASEFFKGDDVMESALEDKGASVSLAEIGDLIWDWLDDDEKVSLALLRLSA